MFESLRFLRKLGRDAAADWPPPRIDHVVIDTTTQTVCGLRLPCDLEALRAIGRPSNRHALVDRLFAYHDLGATFFTDLHGRVSDVGVCLIDSDGDGSPAAQCNVIGAAGRCELRPGSRVNELLIALGDRHLIRRDEDEWTFRLGAFDLSSECASDGTLRYFNYFAVDA